MKDNDLDNIALPPMADAHFEITSRKLDACQFSELAKKAVRAVLVDRQDPDAVLVKFSASPDEFKFALQSYSEAWEQYCKENDLVTAVFWLPPKIAESARAIESHALSRIEERHEKTEVKSRPKSNVKKSS